MVDEDVPCEDVLSQINAEKSALHRCRQVVLEEHIKHCVLCIRLQTPQVLQQGRCTPDIKIKMRLAMMVYAIVRGILGGYLLYVLLYFLSGIISELILHKSGYGSVKGLTISYVTCQLCAALGSTIHTYVITVKSMADMAVTDGQQGVDMSENSGLRGINCCFLLILTEEWGRHLTGTIKAINSDRGSFDHVIFKFLLIRSST